MASQGVRFSSVNEEFPADQRGSAPVNAETEDDIQQLKSTLQNTVQSRRAEQYAFEPVSLPNSQPVSRVCRHRQSQHAYLSILIASLGPFWYDYTFEKNARRIRRSLSSTISTSICCTLASSHTSRHLKRRKAFNGSCHTGTGAKSQSSRRQHHTTTIYISWTV